MNYPRQTKSDTEVTEDIALGPNQLKEGCGLDHHLVWGQTNCSAVKEESIVINRKCVTCNN